MPDAQASVAVNSLGLLDLVQIAAEGLAPKSQYQVYLAEANHAPFGKLEALAVLKTNPDGAGIVQAISLLKHAHVGTLAAARHHRRDSSSLPAMHDSSQGVLPQTNASTVHYTFC